MKYKILLASVGLAISLNAIADEPVWDANTVDLKLEQLSDGVYAVYDDRADHLEGQGIPLATSAGIIVGDKGVLLVDTMMTERLHNQLIELVRDVTDKPIKYAVNTSYHGDHSYGNYLLDDSVTIIQHKFTQQYIDEKFEADVNFMLQWFKEGRGIENAVPTEADILVGKNSEIEIDLGGKTVQIKDFGFAQTGGDLFVWLPEEKVMWMGNPVVAEAPAIPWLLDGHMLETLDTLQAVYDFLPEGSTIVPGHSLPTSIDALKWNIDYLKEAKKLVGISVEEGLSKDDTVIAVPMDEFRGYALFDWLHPTINLPAAWDDLSKLSGDENHEEANKTKKSSKNSGGALFSMLILSLLLVKRNK